MAKKVSRRVRKHAPVAIDPASLIPETRSELLRAARDVLIKADGQMTDRDVYENLLSRGFDCDRTYPSWVRRQLLNAGAIKPCQIRTIPRTRNVPVIRTLPLATPVIDARTEPGPLSVRVPRTNNTVEIALLDRIGKLVTEYGANALRGAITIIERLQG